MTHLVSILIPAYNAERWIAETICSALGQTWPNKEIIVVDDGSTDQTVRVAQQFASKTVSIVSQKNQGQPRPETRRSNFAMETMFNGLTPTTFCHQTNRVPDASSRGVQQRDEPFSLRRGPLSDIGQLRHGSFRLRSGPTLTQLSG